MCRLCKFELGSCKVARLRRMGELLKQFDGRRSSTRKDVTVLSGSSTSVQKRWERLSDIHFG